jgi:hypothetical protein
MSKIRLAGFKKLGHDLGSKNGSDPSTDGAGYMFYGPRLDSAQLMAALSGITVSWTPVPYRTQLGTASSSPKEMSVATVASASTR